MDDMPDDITSKAAPQDDGARPSDDTTEQTAEDRPSDDTTEVSEGGSADDTDGPSFDQQLRDSQPASADAVPYMRAPDGMPQPDEAQHQLDMAAADLASVDAHTSDHPTNWDAAAYDSYKSEGGASVHEQGASHQAAQAVGASAFELAEGVAATRIHPQDATESAASADAVPYMRAPDGMPQPDEALASLDLGVGDDLSIGALLDSALAALEAPAGEPQEVAAGPATAFDLTLDAHIVQGGTVDPGHPGLATGGEHFYESAFGAGADYDNGDLDASFDPHDPGPGARPESDWTPLAG